MKPIRALLTVLVLAATLAGFLATPATTDASGHHCAYFGSTAQPGTLVVDYTTPNGGWFITGRYRSDNIQVRLSKDGSTVYFWDRSQVYVGSTRVNISLEGSFPASGGAGGQYVFVDKTLGTTITKTGVNVEILPCP